VLCGSPNLQALNEPMEGDNNINSVVVRFLSDSSYSGRGMKLGYRLRGKENAE